MNFFFLQIQIRKLNKKKNLNKFYFYHKKYRSNEFPTDSPIDSW